MKSGIHRPRGYDKQNCNDRPGMEFGIPEIDGHFCKRFIRDMAPIVQRNYAIMEVRNNLLENERKKFLDHFDNSRFKRVAVVAIGEPPAEFKQETRDRIFKAKRDK